MIETIISNNCTGGAVCHELGMEFKTPTINLQILPEEFREFCCNLSYYMNARLMNYVPAYMSDRHKDMLKKMFGGIPDMPYGIINDILVCFQHYNTFEEARTKWKERKSRIDWDHIGYIFHVRGPEYGKEAEMFIREGIPNSLVITEGFELNDSIALYPKKGDNAFSAVNGKLLITQAADYKSWRELG